jgi:cytoskeletal protein CcmA (bactofilin family)
VQAKDLSTVNGSVNVGESSTVSGEIEAVNGAIRVEQGTTVGGDVGNVNGKIELTGAEVGGDVSTVNGDVRLDGGSVVKGDLIVEKPSGWSWGKSKSRKPTVVIGPGSVVVGNIVLEREVELYISESAKVGGVTGVMSIDDAERFSGDRP